MDRAEEERSCMATLLGSLEHAALCYRGQPDQGVTPLTFSEALEFIDLTNQLLESELDPNRLQVLLFSVEPSHLQVMKSILTTNPTACGPDNIDAIQTLQQRAIISLTRMISLVANDDSLSARYRAALVESGISETVSRYLAIPNETCVNLAVEYIFNVTTKLNAVADLVALRIGPYLCDQLLQPAGINTTVRDYVATVLLRCCKERSQDFIDNDFVNTCIVCIEQLTPTSTATILLECLQAVVSDFPSVYEKVISLDMRKRLGHALAGAIQVYELVEPACSLIEAIAVLEASECINSDTAARLVGTTEDPEEHFLDNFLASGGAAGLADNSEMSTQGTTAVVRMKCLLLLCECSVTNATTTDLVEQLLGNQRSLSMMLSAPLKLPPFHTDSDEHSMTASLVLCLLLAKHPLAREYVAEATRIFPGWVRNLDDELVQQIERAFATTSIEISIVDRDGRLLNAIATIEQFVPGAWYSVTGIQNAARLIFGLPPKPEDPHTQQNGGQAAFVSSNTLTQGFKRSAATLAVLTQAVLMTFAPEEHEGLAAMAAARGDIPVQTLIHTDNTEPLAEWETEEHGEDGGMPTSRSEEESAPGIRTPASVATRDSFPPSMASRRTSGQLEGKPAGRSAASVSGLPPAAPQTLRSDTEDEETYSIPGTTSDRYAAALAERGLLRRGQAIRSAPQMGTYSDANVFNHQVQHPRHTAGAHDRLVDDAAMMSGMVRRDHDGHYSEARSPTASKRGGKQRSVGGPRPWR